METVKSQFFPVAISAALLFTLGLSCDRGVEPPPPQKVELTLENTSTTEVWLKLAFPDGPTGGDFSISRDGTTAAQGRFSRPDTIIVDDSLMPGRTYTYVGNKLENGLVVGSSSPLQVRTMDSTSHNFTWQTFVLGDGNSSILNDVAIINDTLIYAVGEIYLRDSSGQFDRASSVAKWNGLQWQIIKVFDTANRLIPSIRGIFVFNPNDIWLADGGVHHWDGVSPQVSASYDRISLIGGTENGQSVNKLWGASPTDLYGVGWKGMVAHYNGTSWRKIESGTTLDMQDIWGSSTEVIAVASNPFGGPQRKILAISGNQITTVSDSGITQPLDGVWFSSNRRYYVVGSGIYYKTSLDQGTWRGKPLDFTPYYSHAIRGSEINNVVVVGAFGDVLHYNGSSWKRYTDMELQSFPGQYNAVDIRGTTVVAVGFLNNGQGIALIGKR